MRLKPSLLAIVWCLGSAAQAQDALPTLYLQPVKAYLVSPGVSSATPVALCADLRGTALIRCLIPNRGVEVEPIVIERRVN